MSHTVIQTEGRSSDAIELDILQFLGDGDRTIGVLECPSPRTRPSGILDALTLLVTLAICFREDDNKVFEVARYEGRSHSWKRLRLSGPELQKLQSTTPAEQWELIGTCTCLKSNAETAQDDGTTKNIQDAVKVQMRKLSGGSVFLDLFSHGSPGTVLYPQAAGWAGANNCVYGPAVFQSRVDR